MQVDLNEKPMNIDAFCDSMTHKKEVDPRLILKDKKKMDLITKKD